MTAGPSERKVRVRYDDLDELARRAHAENPKAHDIAAIDESVDRWGYVTPVVVNEAGDRILEDHGIGRARGNGSSTCQANVLASPV